MVPDLVGRTRVSATRDEIVVQGEGRTIRSVVLLPDGYGPGRPHNLVFAVHNFAGDAEGFAKLVHAERLRSRGNIVVLPQAEGMIPEWQGPGITITFGRKDQDGRPVDDVAGLLRTLAVARRLYARDATAVDILGFSQGATVALALAQALDRGRAGTVRNLFLAAGSVAGGQDPSLAIEGTTLVVYEPGRNGPQHVANVLTREPNAREYIPWIVAAKGCTIDSRETADGLERRIYRCRDGRRLVHIWERDGEHAWPGQDAEYDNVLLGRGSLSRIDFTTIIASELSSGRQPPFPR